MAEISKITLPGGNTYDIKDTSARNSIDNIKTSISSGIHYIGLTNSDVHDGATTNAIILVKPVTKNGVTTTEVVSTTPYTPKTGDLVIKDNKEYIYAISETSTAGVWHEFGSTGSLKALAFKDNASAGYTPAGSVSQPSFTGTAATINVNGSVGIPAPTPKASIQDPASTSIALPEHAQGATDYTQFTPKAVASGAAVSLNTASIQQITGVGTLPSFNASVSEETLTLGWSAGSLPSRAGVTVATGVASVTQPKVTVGTVDITFKGSSVNVASSGSYTPAGSVSKPTFAGTEATITVK